MVLKSFLSFSILLYILLFECNHTQAQSIKNIPANRFPDIYEVIHKNTFVNPERGQIAFAGYNIDDIPFFCKMEHKIERRSKIPFRFRLGNLNYVNKLENKVNHYIFAE